MFEELGRQGGGHRSVLIERLVRNRLSMFFLNVHHYDSQRPDFIEYVKTVLPPDAFEAFLHGNILIKLYFVWEKRKVC